MVGWEEHGCCAVAGEGTDDQVARMMEGPENLVELLGENFVDMAASLDPVVYLGDIDALLDTPSGHKMGQEDHLVACGPSLRNNHEDQ